MKDLENQKVIEKEFDIKLNPPIIYYKNKKLSFKAPLGA